MHRLKELVRLHRLGVGNRESARLLQMSPNTEREYRHTLEEAKLWNGPADDLPSMGELLEAVRKLKPERLAPQCASSAEPYRKQIESMLEKGSSPRAIYDRLRLEDQEFKCSPSAVKRFCSRWKKDRGVTPDEVVIPVVSKAGEVAQVDFGYVGKLYDPSGGVLRKAWLFVMSLPYSKKAYMDIVFDQKVATFIQLHERAFRFFGGVPQVVVPDNLKSAVIKASFHNGQSTELNRSYAEAARHYGFKIDPTPAYSPNKKGVVESNVKYAKRNFFLPRLGELKDIEDARNQLRSWLKEVFDKRVHGSTGESPLVRFEREEKAVLLPLPEKRFETVIWKQATVHRDSHVSFEHRLYSVPYRLIGQKVWVRAQESTLTIFADDVRVATHDRATQKRSTHEDHLPKERSELRHRSQKFWEERAKLLGPTSLEYVRAVFGQDDALFQLRNVQRIVSELYKVPAHRAEAACKRALYFDNYSPTAVRDILRKGLDARPCEERSEPPSKQQSFAYSRTVDEILAAHLSSEVNHVIH